MESEAGFSLSSSVFLFILVTLDVNKWPEGDE
ncbi:hypothetical protein BCF53_106143 [Reinekea marinisedimentorum]|uniref:Uncharacterized protein n=1 Tax=Reinekea marinisedimentorum TaxID=230495 RepID=A0A4R3I851_9GAMM|nr:hypothetical protein BCF53_106143 [Reinekea marinisedimentorum]